MIEQLPLAIELIVFIGIEIAILIGIGCTYIILYNICMAIISCIMVSRTKPVFLKRLADKFIHSISERD